ncbi:MAG: hypothetical protein Fur0010_09500 [Bdellovibrio sp.]
MKRRDFITYTALLSTGGFLGYFLGHKNPDPTIFNPFSQEDFNKVNLNGTLICTGSRYNDSDFESALTIIDLAKQKVETKIIPAKSAHFSNIIQNKKKDLVVSSEDSILILDSRNYEIKKKISFNNDQKFDHTTHPVFIDDLLYVAHFPIKLSNEPAILTALDATNKYDIVSQNVIGPNPHVMLLSQDQRRLFITSTIKLFDEDTGEYQGGSARPRKSEVLLFDLNNKQLIPSNFKVEEFGGLSHISLGRNDQILGTLRLFKNKEKFKLEDMPANATTSKSVGRMAGEAQLLLWQDGKPLRIGKPKYHRAQQSTTFHHLENKFYVTYKDSNIVSEVNAASGICRYFNSEEFGINEPAGISYIYNTPFVAVVGKNSGIAIVDFSQRKLVRYYELATYNLIHSTFILT